MFKELTEGPDNKSGLLSDFQGDVKLENKPKIEDGHVTLDFNEAIYGSADGQKKVISDEVLNSIVLTLTELPMKAGSFSEPFLMMTIRAGASSPKT